MFTKIELTGSSNTRDLGGLPADGGRKIRPKRLIRSCSLSSLTGADKDRLRDTYNLKTIVDFRTEKEVAEKPDPEISGTAYYHVPVIEDVAAGITHDSESEGNSFQSTIGLLLKHQVTPQKYMEDMYRDIASNEYSRKAYIKFFDILLSQQTGAVLWHCSAGKDRAGIGTALILSALGVPRDIVIKDYLMTGEFLKNAIANTQDKIREKTDDEALLNCIRVCMEVEQPYIESVFDIFEKESGSVPAFLEDKLGLTKEKTDQLKEIYLI